MKEYDICPKGTLDLVIKLEKENEELNSKLMRVSKLLFEIPLDVDENVNKTLEDIDTVLFGEDKL